MPTEALTLEDVDRIAAEYHRGQFDKSGRPYIRHPRAVAAGVKAAGGDANQQMAALLHDVVEDTAATPTDLIERGVPAAVVTIVEAMTHQPDEPYEDYLTRLVRTPGAACVKRADIADNTDPDRLRRLPAPLRARLTAKYARALRQLDALAPG